MSVVIPNTSAPFPESVRVLDECKELQLKKSRDYQNPMSTVKQAHHYRRGVSTIYDMIDQKMRRAQSLIETMEANAGKPNFEPLEDTLKDIINYSSFAVSYLRGKMDGQLLGRDALNRPSACAPCVPTTGVVSQLLVEADAYVFNNVAVTETGDA